MLTQKERKRLFEEAKHLLFRTIKILDEAYEAHLKAVKADIV